MITENIIIEEEGYENAMLLNVDLFHLGYRLLRWAVLDQFVMGMFLYTIRFLDHVDEISYVFLESGHTQQEGDAMHSCIARASKNIPIYSIEGWSTVCRVARANPRHYEVEVTDSHEYFIDFHKIGELIALNRYKGVTLSSGAETMK